MNAGGLLGGLYGAVIGGRNRLYDRGWLGSYRSALPVASIGNLSAGGNAKTPLCRWLAEALAVRGLRPVVLSRGFGGSCPGPMVVDPGDRAARTGDEPLMLARSGLTVVVARDRCAGARFIEARHLGDVIILDDGLQHRRLRRDVEIVCIDSGTDEAVERFLRGELLPAGPFREARDRALRRADLVVFADRAPAGGGRDLDARLLKLVPDARPWVRCFLRIEGVHALNDRTERLAPRPAAAFCGIASPRNFFFSLESLGFQLAGRRAFRDHHRFTPEEIASLRREFAGLPLICTEKDAVRLEGWNDSRGIFVLGAAAEVSPADVFMAEIERRLRAARRLLP